MFIFFFKTKTRKSSAKNPKIIVKLLVSINRREGRLSAEENLALLLKCAQSHADIVKGMDLSGDPKFGAFNEYKDLLEQARQSGLKLALHCGEIDNEDEIAEMLAFGMSRLGHGTCINGESLFKCYGLLRAYCALKLLLPCFFYITRRLKCLSFVYFGF